MANSRRQRRINQFSTSTAIAVLCCFVTSLATLATLFVWVDGATSPKDAHIPQVSKPIWITLPAALAVVSCCIWAICGTLASRERRELQEENLEEILLVNNGGNNNERFNNANFIIAIDAAAEAIKVSNDALIDHLNLLANDNTHLEPLTDSEIEIFRNIITNCEDEILKNNNQKSLDNYLENISCGFSLEIPTSPLTVSWHTPMTEEQPRTRSWVKTYDIENLKTFINNTCTNDHKIAFAPHSPDDLLQVENDCVTFKRGYSEAINEFVNYAQSCINQHLEKDSKQRLHEVRLQIQRRYNHTRLFATKATLETFKTLEELLAAKAALKTLQELSQPLLQNRPAN